MKAWVQDRYGSPDILELRDVDTPTVGDDQVLVRVRACAVNPYDWHLIRGVPVVARSMMRKGYDPRGGATPGADVAGVVEAVGSGVTRFKVGDEVYGEPHAGGLAEAVAIREDSTALKPPRLSFEQAAGIPMAALTALQGLRDHGKLRAGQRVLVNGAGGGIGTFAVQLAKVLGAAEVTGVCGPGKAELVRSLGADRVLDYMKEDFTRDKGRYDLVFDTVGNHGVLALRRAAATRGTVVLAGGGAGRIIGPIGHIARGALLNRFSRATIGTFVCRPTVADVDYVRGLVADGGVRSVVGRTFPFASAPEAIRFLEEGHATGKVIVTM